MMGSSIKNSNAEVTISQNPVEALRNNRSVAQSSHKGLIKSTGITRRGEELLSQGLSFDEEKSSMLQPHEPILASASPMTMTMTMTMWASSSTTHQ